MKFFVQLPSDENHYEGWQKKSTYRISAKTILGIWQTCRKNQRCAKNNLSWAQQKDQWSMWFSGLQQDF